MKRILLLIILSIVFSACTSSNSTDKSTEYKSNDQKYGTDDWRDIKDKNRLEEKSSLMSAKPKVVNKEKEFIDSYLKNLEKNLLLNYKEFNETPHKGWRVYFESKDYVSAHKLIDAYILKHKESLTEVQIKSLSKNSDEIKALLNKK